MPDPSEPHLSEPSAPMRNRFAQQAEGRETSLPRQLLALLLQNKKYWMIPIILGLLLFGLLLVLGSTSAAPFIYTLF